MKTCVKNYMWSELQNLANLERSKKNAEGQLAQNLRQRAAQTEMQLSRIRNLQAAVDKLVAIKQSAPPAISLIQSQNIFALVKWFYSHPHELANALKYVQDADCEKIARFIVWDLFENEENEDALLECISAACELLKDDIVKPNSICAHLIKHYLQRFGQNYLAHTLKYFLC